MSNLFQDTNSESRPRAGIDAREFVHRIDAQDSIDYLNDAWLAFARESGSHGLTAENLFGRKIWDFIADFETREIYSAIVHRVRETGGEVRIPFRCDDARVRRFMETSIRALPGKAVEFRNRILREEFRAPVPLLDHSRPRSGAVLKMCAWCKRVLVSGKWLEVEEGAASLDLFDSPKLPTLSHGICPPCMKSYF